MQFYNNTIREQRIIALRLETLEKEKEVIIEYQKQLEEFNEFLKENIKEMETNLKQLNGIEQMIYYEVVVNGLSVTKAIDRVSYKVDKDSSTLWKNYYPKVKQKIMALKKMQ